MRLIFATLLLAFSLFPAKIFAQESELKIGYISYWGDNIAKYDNILDGSIAVINPSDGALISKGQKYKPVANIQSFKLITENLKRKDVKVIGYVPTGYFNHECNEIGQCQEWSRIEKQVETYFKEIPNLDGIFFDEAAPSNWNCSLFPDEYSKLRKIVESNKSNATIAFNAGVADNCVVSGLIKDEIGVLFEGSPQDYLTQSENLIASARAAHEKGAKVWHLVHSLSDQVLLNKILNNASVYKADYFYSSPISGDWQNGHNTWGEY